MRFLLFNLAVIGALFYLFGADRSGSDIGNDFREDPLQVIRQELESLARDVAEGRKGADQTPPETIAVEMPRDGAQVPTAGRVDSAPVAPNDPSVPAASASAKTASAGQDVAPAAAQASKVLEDDRREARAAADPIGPLPQVDDPSVARRRAEVLDGAAPLDDRRGETPVEGRPPMSPEERLRKLYSLAEEMELLYVSKMTR